MSVQEELNNKRKESKDLIHIFVESCALLKMNTSQNANILIINSEF